jgi:radical SAM protein with 4Fe4S-binding SPASM domain
MNTAQVAGIPITEFKLWSAVMRRHVPVCFELELTARCNNNCAHCYINVPADSGAARNSELTFEQIKELVDEAVALGSLWCVLTGGEPLLRPDFEKIYRYLKSKGLLVTLFSNATLIEKEHIRLFKRFPPRSIEISVYGIRRQTYERVTRSPGSFEAFCTGLNRLLGTGLDVRLKTMALQSNVQELPAIGRFCRGVVNGSFRFDPFLHLRLDGSPHRNGQIRRERLTAEQVVAVEQADPQRRRALERQCRWVEPARFSAHRRGRLFHCSIGNNHFTIGHDGSFRLCASLCHPDCIYDLKCGSLSHAWNHFVEPIQMMETNRRRYLDKCHGCTLRDLCMWCPALAYLETGQLDAPVGYFCELAHARSAAQMPTRLVSEDATPPAPDQPESPARADRAPAPVERI